jgi:hypothetical protein
MQFVQSLASKFCGASLPLSFRGKTARVYSRVAAGKLPPSAAPKLAGEHTASVTPVPIPNTEVKPRRADGTARVSVWEIR